MARDTVSVRAKLSVCPSGIMPWAAACGSQCGIHGPTGRLIFVVSRKVPGVLRPTSPISARLDRNQRISEVHHRPIRFR
jgi:hypothetical protein